MAKQSREILVNAKEYKETTNPNEYLRTCEIDSCVGLALVEDLNGVKKRGLTYISYDTSNCYDENSVCRLSPASEQRGNNILEKIVSQFIGLKRSKGFPKQLEGAERIRAYVVANRTKQEKAKTSKRDIALPDDIGQVNPMFDFILKWVCEKGLTVALSDANSKWKKEGDKLDPNAYPIHTKIILLHPKKINILYMKNDGKILNSDTYSHPI